MAGYKHFCRLKRYPSGGLFGNDGAIVVSRSQAVGWISSPKTAQSVDLPAKTPKVFRWLPENTLNGPFETRSDDPPFNSDSAGGLFGREMGQQRAEQIVWARLREQARPYGHGHMDAIEVLRVLVRELRGYNRTPITPVGCEFPVS